MADRVYLHIGLLKTGTTYLQNVAWANKARLATEGIHLPGPGHRQHLWAALDLLERRGLARRHPDAPGSWERLCAELDRTGGTGLITHEFFSGASEEQARRAVERLAPAEVHLIVTARDTAGILATGWQEAVKHGSTLTLAETAASTADPDFSWRTWDMEGVLRRWAPTVPVERVHLLPLPPKGSAPDQHWRNFAELIGYTGEVEIRADKANSSIGVVQIELMRRLNRRLDAFHTPFDRGHWLRSYLAMRNLGAQPAERFAMPADLLEECRERSRRAVGYIAQQGFPVHGDLSSILVPEQDPGLRTVESVTAEEMLDSASELVAAMLQDVRRLSHPEPPPAERPAAPTAGPARRLLSRLRHRLGR